MVVRAQLTIAPMRCVGQVTSCLSWECPLPWGSVDLSQRKGMEASLHAELCARWKLLRIRIRPAASGNPHDAIDPIVHVGNGLFQSLVDPC